VLKETYGSYALDVSARNPQVLSIRFGFPERYIPGTRQCSIFAYSKFEIIFEQIMTFREF